MGEQNADPRDGLAAMAAPVTSRPLPAEEQRLREAALRMLSTPKAGVALVLRLSLLRPPLPRPHHHRIARAILEEAAQRHRGEMFEPACGDMVLLCRAPSLGVAASALQPTALPHTLARLFRADASAVALTTLWMLERDGTALLAYVSRLAEAATPELDLSREA